MVPLMSLWLPILLSAVAVFVASSILHMVLKYHHGDFRKVPDEEGMRAALRPFNLAPGDYHVPGKEPGQKWNDPAILERMKQGPVALITVVRAGAPNMGPALAQWFVYSVLVGLFTAYVTGGLIGPGAEYLHVHRYAATVAFAGYGLALLQSSIWYNRSWSATMKSVFDALVYALVTGGVFGWLWPSS
ncbi:MAG: hypothetical protein IH621_05615 [Krumholzibacteria bacterium]|nr:hypothetical protein [Candidatus Krumholzibacteria bacterium]